MQFVFIHLLTKILTNYFWHCHCIIFWIISTFQIVVNKLWDNIMLGPQNHINLILDAKKLRELSGFVTITLLLGTFVAERITGKESVERSSDDRMIGKLFLNILLFVTLPSSFSSGTFVADRIIGRSWLNLPWILVFARARRKRFISSKPSLRYDFFFILIERSWSLFTDEFSGMILMLVGPELFSSILIVASGSSATNKNRSFLQCENLKISMIEL